MACFGEIEGKRAHDPHKKASWWVPGPVIIGAGPSGLAVAACLKAKGIPSLVIERSHCIASLWQLKSYDRLLLHLPKNFCELPLMPFPATFPTYPTKEQFISYLKGYAEAFKILPTFGEAVVSAEYDGTEAFKCWRVTTESVNTGQRMEYLTRWMVAATGENAEEVVPQISGISDFKGTLVHTSQYRNGEAYRGKRVLVVGCGNSGMEVCFDLCNYDVRPGIVVRNKIVDRLLLLVSRFMLGDIAQFGLHSPKIGPLELKAVSGKTPVLDAGTLAKIKSGEIKVFPTVKRFTDDGVEFCDGRREEFDAVILATGYRSNVPTWLKENSFFSEEDGMPRKPFPHGWKGERGLYAAGFTKKGLLGTSIDAVKIAQDIVHCWSSKMNQKIMAFD